MENLKPIISIQHLAKNFGSKEVLKDINLDVYPGEVVSVIGSSGSGKSTMLRCINKLEEATSGQIFFPRSSLTASPARVCSRTRAERILVISPSFIAG